MSQFLNNKGGYRNLRVYRLSEIIYDLSMIFAKQYIRAGSRTRDQIKQAARSGKQNIAEGSVASTTSIETEIKLTNVAKASLEELLLDYEDFLRQNKLPQWHKNHPRTIRLREYLKSDDFLNNPTEYDSAICVSRSSIKPPTCFAARLTASKTNSCKKAVSASKCMQPAHNTASTKA